MPFREMCRLESQIEMVSMLEAGRVSVTHIAALCGVSRETFYYWAGRKATGGERPQALDRMTVKSVLTLRRRFRGSGRRSWWRSSSWSGL